MAAKLLVLVLLLSPEIAIAQSPFDGTWQIDPASLALPAAPAEFLLRNGTFRCKGCLAAVAIAADGREHAVPDGAYWNAASVRPLDGRTVEIRTSKDGKTYYTETDRVSADGRELTQRVRDTTEAEAVWTTTSFHRIGTLPTGAHAISGRWRAYRVEKSPNGLIVSYRCTAEGFSARTPLGESYAAKFDGTFVLTEDDPGQTMVAVKRINERTVETTIKRGDRIAGSSRLMVSSDGQTLYGLYFDAGGKQTGSVVMHRKP